MPAAIHLVLFHDPPHKTTADMHQIAALARQLDPGLRPRVLSVYQSHLWTPLRLVGRPTVTVEFDRPPHFNLLRGQRLRQLPDSKLAAGRQLQAAGLPVPEFTVIAPDTVLDPATWGPYVVVKPDRGGRGAYVRFHRTSRVRYRPPHELPADHPGRHCPLLAQRFIHTGRWPVSHRVLTLFGEPLLGLCHEGRQDGPPLDDAAQPHGGNIVASAIGGRISLERDPELLDLARRVHAVFPTVPLLGQDLVRDARTGRCYVLEVNPTGDVWAFTSRTGRQMQASFGLDFYRQFDALPTAARVLATVARRYAR